MSVKAKFQCNSIVDLGYTVSVNFSAVYGTEGENADYAKATPCGNLNLNIDKETKAAEEFERGKEYYLIFEKIN
jgi:hypothetical protein